MAIQRSSLFAALGLSASALVAWAPPAIATEEAEVIAAAALRALPQPDYTNPRTRTILEIDYRIDLLEEVMVEVRSQLDQAMVERAAAEQRTRQRLPVPKARLIDTASLDHDQSFGTLAPDERGDLENAVIVQAVSPARAAPPMAAERRSSPNGLRIAQVHFNTGAATLSPGAVLRVGEAVARIQAAPRQQIRVVAFTDTTGSSKLNRRLSLERAVAIADQLERAGVDGGLIEVVANGEHNTPIKTTDGIAEPLNRCAGIFLVDH